MGRPGAVRLEEPRRRSEAEIAAEGIRRGEERRRFDALRPPMTAAEAQREIQRSGRPCYRASVTGGRADRWFVSGMGAEVTDDQLVAKAEQLRERRRAA